ncbi:MAG: DUF6541 family protein [Brooklawnia sp.]|jgi:hypothetical protein
MTWAQALPHILVAIGLVYLPGLALLWPVRLPALARAAAAPMLGILVIAGSALLAGALDVNWSWIWVVATTVLATGPLAWLRRRSAPAPRDTGRDRGVLLRYLAGVLIAGVVLGPSIIGALGSPEFFAQRHDNVFHLNAIRFVADTGSGSPLSFGTVGATGYYPAAWYDWAGLLVQLTGAPVTVASNAIMLVSIFAVWPLALGWLAESCLPIADIGRALVGPLALACVSFPLALLDWGPLFPNLLGLSLAPVVIAAGWHGLGRSRAPRLGLGFSVALLVAGVAATVLTHPNATLTAGLLLMPVAVAALWRARPRTGVRPQWIRGSRVWTLLVLAGTVAFPVLWLFATTRLADTEREGFMLLGAAAGEVLAGTSLGKTPIMVITIGLLVGLLFAIRRRRLWPLLAGFVLVGAGYVATTTLGDALVASLFAAPFYNDPYRVGAIVALPSLLIAVLGWDVGVRWLLVRTRRLTAGRVGSAAHLRTVLALVLAAALTVAMLASLGWRESVARVQYRFALNEASDIITSNELALIERVPQHVPVDAVIAANPWHGGSMVYAFTGRQVTQYYMTRVPSADVELINSNLNRAAFDPAVCDAVRSVGAGFVLVLEPHVLWSVRQEPPNLGLTGLEASPGFELLDSQGDAALYRITACG